MADSIETQRKTLMKVLDDLGMEHAKVESEVNARRKRLASIERMQSEARGLLRELELKEHAERTKVASK